MTPEVSLDSQQALLCLYFDFGIRAPPCHRAAATDRAGFHTNRLQFPTPDLSCAQDNDCALARRIDRCCACAGIFNREQVETDPRLRYVFEPEGYRYVRSRRIGMPWECASVMCAPCPEPPFGLVCDSGTCRAAQTWQEALAACPKLPPSRPMDWCYQHGDHSLTVWGAGSGPVHLRAICQQRGTMQTTT